MLKKYDNKAGRAAGWKGMVEAKKSGKVKSIGVSNFTIRHLLEIKAMGLGMPAVNQVEMNAFYQQPELKAFCDSENIILTAYAPLTAPGLTKGKFLKDERLVAIAKKHNKTPA
jgi:diketogulonate reductase-like aldo/keto reductase